MTTFPWFKGNKHFEALSNPYMCVWPNSSFTIFVVFFLDNSSFGSLCSSFLYELWFCKPLLSYFRGIRVLQVFALVRRIRVLQMFALFSYELEFYNFGSFFMRIRVLQSVVSCFICYAFVFVLFMISVRIIELLRVPFLLISTLWLATYIYYSTGIACNQ